MPRHTSCADNVPLQTPHPCPGGFLAPGQCLWSLKERARCLSPESQHHREPRLKPGPTAWRRHTRQRKWLVPAQLAALARSPMSPSAGWECCKGRGEWELFRTITSQLQLQMWASKSL